MSFSQIDLSKPPFANEHLAAVLRTTPAPAPLNTRSSGRLRMPFSSHHARTKTSPAPLPRSSSLLPPPEHLDNPRLLTDPDASRQRIDLAKPVSGRENLPRRSHSRSSSASASNENPGLARNRWSVSTTSSKTSPVNVRPSGRSTHRLSVDANAWLSQPAVDHSPRRLQKNRRRSSSSDATDAHRVPVSSLRSRSPTHQILPPIGLPPIAALPALPQFNRDGPSSSRSPDAGKDYDDEPTIPGHLPSPTSQGGNSKKATSQAKAKLGGSPRNSPRNSPTAKKSQKKTKPRAEDTMQSKGHSRNRSQGAKGSSDSTASSKAKGNKPLSQKAMLSKALQRANTAVQLDNAQNFEGARQSYAEACDLLAQVLSRTSTDEDKRKLEAIKQTYTSRIDELDQMELVRSPDGKELPARPESFGLRPGPVLHVEDDETEEIATIETATLTKIIKDSSRNPVQAKIGAPVQVNARNRNNNDAGYGGPPRRTGGQHPLQSSFSRAAPAIDLDDRLIFQRPIDDIYAPPPLSPRRAPSPRRHDGRMSPDVAVRSDFSLPASQGKPRLAHLRTPSKESNSWLDPIDESGGSSASSIHSRTSSMGFRRKHIRSASGATEAEFDAALDAAVEAAYNDGYEVMGTIEREASGSDDDIVARAMRKVELAKERVRQTEREAFELAEDLQRQRAAQQRKDSDTINADFFDDGSSEDEERILEEMTRSLAADSTISGPSSRSNVPRESDSSGFTSRTWHSSLGSNPPTTATTTMTTIPEPISAMNFANTPPSAPPPSHSLPQLPTKAAASAARGASPENFQTVRNRRLSGQNPKQLKIETGKFGAPTKPPQRAMPSQSASDSKAAGADDATDSSSHDANTGRPASSDSQISPTQAVPPTLPIPEPAIQGEDDVVDSRASSPVAFPSALRKNFSSSSLRSLRSRNLSISNPDDASDLSPGTPLSSGFGGTTRLPSNLPTIATPLAGSFKDKTYSAGGLYLFDDSFHSQSDPGSPNPHASGAPAQLEPCPTDYMLRPFWLMRCLYQTLVHPRGGYISNKLFIPRDVWKVKGVKLRNLDDKIATCDYLTAALLKLARVDTCDADAVLEEMQSLEGVLEQAQASLSRKLGVEVGVQSTATLFKEASNSAEIEAAINVPRSASVSGKSSFSWRRLRSKNSGAGLGNAYNKNNSAAPESGKESPGLETLPMTANPTSRPTKRDVSSAKFTGPQANYMGSLARLFDAAQTIDQIARQVEDPGLRHADKTQVGLELCTRHAAEFFGFYICRFVLTDVSVLLDKFIKRGTEWVLA